MNIVLQRDLIVELLQMNSLQPGVIHSVAKYFVEKAMYSGIPIVSIILVSSMNSNLTRL